MYPREQAHPHLQPGVLTNTASSPTPPTVGAGSGEHSICNTPPPIPCGSEPARDKIDTAPEPNTPPASPKSLPPTAPTYTPLSSYASLRLCLQLRQNPPACAPCPRVLLSSCHCPSVVGFSSPVHISVVQALSVRYLPVLDGGCVHGALGRAGFGVITGLLTCAQPPPFRLVARWCGLL